MNTEIGEVYTGSAAEDAMKPVFIVNPVAGTKMCEKQFAQAEEQLKAMGAEYTVRLSEYPGHSVELARQALAEGRRFIVAVGGDGTVNEVKGNGKIVLEIDANVKITVDKASLVKDFSEAQQQ